MPEIETNVTATPKSVRKTSPVLRFALYAVPIILLAAIGIPNYVKSRTTACVNACINNLRQIDGAKEQFALESKLPLGTEVTAEQISPYLKGGVIPTCPAEGKISIGVLGQLPNCDSLEGHTLATPQASTSKRLDASAVQSI